MTRKILDIIERHFSFMSSPHGVRRGSIKDKNVDSRLKPCRNDRVALFGLLAMTAIHFLSIINFAHAEDKIRVVATTSTIASLAREIAGDKVEIHIIASPRRDTHFIEPTPKDVLKVKKANVLIHGGLDLEAWRAPLVEAAGKKDFIQGGPGQIDVSEGVSLLEIPTEISRAQGDIHVFGNPHYWLAPENAKVIIKNIERGLSRLYPDNEASYRGNLEKFQNEIDAKMRMWKSQLEPFQGSKIVTYHKDWPYFAKAFDLEIMGEIEAKPGIPPTAKHLAEIIERMKTENAKLILRDEYQDNRSSEKVAHATGAKVLVLSHETGGLRKETRYVDWMDYNVNQIVNALEEDKSNV